VSSVLNGNRHKNTRVSPETQDRIRRAAAALNYRPNALARSLQRRGTRDILFASYFVGPLLFAQNSGFFAQVLDGALFEAVRRGYDLTIHLAIRGDPHKTALLGDGRADGCLWVAPSPADPALPTLEGGAWPLVVFGAEVPRASMCILADNADAMGQAVEHLTALGHRRLVYVAQGTAHWEDAERGRQFGVACAARGVSAGRFVAALTPPDDSGRTTIVRESMEGLLKGAAGKRPTGLVCFNDYIAAEVIACAHDLGFGVPADLSVIGFDSTHFCESVRPPLTSLRQPLREMAMRCVEVLIAQIEAGAASDAAPAVHASSEPRVERVRCRLDVRASTGPAPVGA
jgi:LacI family transcriptional regulator